MNTAKIRRSSRYGRVVTIKQCDCNSCLGNRYRFRHWLVRRPDGSIYRSCITWEEAVNVAAKFARFYL